MQFYLHVRSFCVCGEAETCHGVVHFAVIVREFPGRLASLTDVE
ncbi:hypothetical protein [Paraburkholderia sp.]